jgi:hypothetical protein
MAETKVAPLSSRLYACGPAARWLPRVLAAAILVAAMLVAYRFDPHRSLTFARSLQGILVVLGAAIGLWIVRSGAELRVRVGLAREGVRFDYGRGAVTLAYDDVVRFDFESPLSSSRRLWPAAVLLDDRGRSWRLPALIGGGERLIRELVAASGRDDLESWAGSLGLARRMGHATALVAVGYTMAAAVVTAAIAFYAH